MRGGGVDAATLVAALGAGPPPPDYSQSPSLQLYRRPAIAASSTMQSLLFFFASLATAAALLSSPAPAGLRRPAVRPMLAGVFASADREPPSTLPKRGPAIPPSTEEGGPLSQILPLSLLLESQSADRSGDLMLGEDAGVFKWGNEKMGKLVQESGDVGRDWATFTVAVGTILSALAVLWIYSPTGYGDDFVAALESACGGNSHLVTLAFGIIFPVVHSGLATLRPYATKVTGAAST